MSKPANVVPAATTRALAAADVVRAAVQTAIAQCPGLISFDPGEEGYEIAMLRALVDPGIDAARRNGWEATVVAWAIAAFDGENKETGEIETLPTLVLISNTNELCRLWNWPAISSWMRIVRAAGVDRLRKGLRVRCYRRPSAGGGRSYWVIVPAEEPL